LLKKAGFNFRTGKDVPRLPCQALCVYLSLMLKKESLIDETQEIRLPVLFPEGGKFFWEGFSMEKLMELLSSGEMPNFLEVLQALNDISDIDWEAQEGIPHRHRGVQNKDLDPNYPCFRSRGFCELC